MVLDELGAYIVAQGLGVLTPAASRTLFKESEAHIPAGDGPYVLLNEYPGTAPSRVQNSRAVDLEYPMVQTVVFHKNPVTAMTLATQLRDAYVQVVNTTLSGIFFLSILPQQKPFGAGLDSTRKRSMVKFNSMVTKRPS